jgi:hypothetical protein
VTIFLTGLAITAFLGGDRDSAEVSARHFHRSRPTGLVEVVMALQPGRGGIGVYLAGYGLRLFGMPISPKAFRETAGQRLARLGATLEEPADEAEAGKAEPGGQEVLAG